MRLPREPGTAPRPRPVGPPARSGRFLAVLALVTSVLGAGCATPPPPSPPTRPTITTPDPRPADDTPPTGALYVAHAGSDRAPGTRDRPLRTVQAALERVGRGGVVAVQGGVWHEALVVDRADGVELRSWPGEVAWFDGSRPLNGFASRDGAWALDGYTVDFDASPTFARGAPDNLESGWSFIDPAHPLAADPQQVWFDGAPLRQVGSTDELDGGSFYVDRGAHRLWLGQDPSGHRVEAADLGRALSIRRPGVRVRGLGFRRFSPSLPDYGAITLEGANITLADVVVADTATVGISLQRPGPRLRDVTVLRSGMIGVDGAHADDARLERVLARQNNTEHFNEAPNAGGMKITASRRVRVVGGSFDDNRGTGLWLDESVEDARLSGIEASGNTGGGVRVELSTGVTLTGSRIEHNGGDGVRVQNANHVAVVADTVIGNRRGVQVVQDERRPRTPGGSDDDPRPGGSADQTWVVGQVAVTGCLIGTGAAGGADGLVAVEDYTERLSGTELGVRLADNLYQRKDAATPAWTHLWARHGAEATTFSDLTAFRAASGEDAASVEVSGPAQTARVSAQPVSRVAGDPPPPTPPPGSGLGAADLPPADVVGAGGHSRG